MDLTDWQLVVLEEAVALGVVLSGAGPGLLARLNGLLGDRLHRRRMNLCVSELQHAGEWSCSRKQRRSWR